MILLEYEAKQLIGSHRVPLPHSQIVESSAPLPYPFVLKSQVPAGGRGKAGGIRLVENNDEFESAMVDLKTISIKGYLPKHILAEAAVEIEREFYLALRLNITDRFIEVIAHKDGGVDVESNATDDFYRTPITLSNTAQIADELGELYDLPEKIYVLENILKGLYGCFIENEALLIEINPLSLTKAGDILALDCKFDIDTAAKFRHPEWSFEMSAPDSNFVTLNSDGNVATIANGAGLAMATVDAVSAAGLSPANFLDVGGGANEASVLAAFKEIVKYPSIHAIVINIFAGITRCDEVAKAILAAKSQIDDLPPLCIRLAGTNVDEAKALLEANDTALLNSLEDCVRLAKGYGS